MKNSFRKGLFHPDDIRTVGLTSSSPGPKTAPLPGLSHKPSRPSLNALPTSGSSTPARGHHRSSSFVNSGSAGRAEARRLHSQPEFGKYAEADEDEDYDDIFDKANGTCECLSACIIRVYIIPCSAAADADTAAEHTAV